MISKIFVNCLLCTTTVSVPVVFGSYFHVSSNNKKSVLDETIIIDDVSDSHNLVWAINNVNVPLLIEATDGTTTINPQIYTPETTTKTPQTSTTTPNKNQSHTGGALATITKASEDLITLKNQLFKFRLDYSNNWWAIKQIMNTNDKNYFLGCKGTKYFAQTHTLTYYPPHIAFTNKTTNQDDCGPLTENTKSQSSVKSPLLTKKLKYWSPNSQTTHQGFDILSSGSLNEHHFFLYKQVTSYSFKQMKYDGKEEIRYSYNYSKYPHVYTYSTTGHSTTNDQMTFEHAYKVFSSIGRQIEKNSLKIQDQLNKIATYLRQNSHVIPNAEFHAQGWENLNY